MIKSYNYKEPLFPMVYFFNTISSATFVRTVRQLSEGIGVVINYNACYFPTDLEESEGNFEGVKFADEYLQAEVIVSYDIVYGFMTAIFDDFVKAHPDSADELYKILEKFATKFGVKFLLNNGEME